MQNTRLKFVRPKIPVLHTNSAMFTQIMSLIPFSPQSSSLKIFKVSNGRPLQRKIPVKINRCLFEIKAEDFGHWVVNIVLNFKEREELIFRHSSTSVSWSYLYRKT